MRHLFGVISVFFVFVACNTALDKRLDHVDSIMQDYPDSALSILQSVAASDFRTGRDKAVYAVLMAEARYKTGIDDTVDSMLMKAVDFFDKEQADDRFCMKGHFYKGIIEMNSKRYGNALVSLLFAENTASILKDTLMSGLIHRAMGDAYDEVQNKAAAVSYYKRCYEELHSLGGCKYEQDAIYDLSRAYNNAEKYDSSINAGKLLLDNDWTKIKEEVHGMQCYIIAKAYLYKGEPERSVEYILKSEGYFKDGLPPRALEVLGVAYLYCNNMDKARECERNLAKVWGDTTDLSYHIARVNKDYKNAFLYLQHQRNLNDSIYREWISQTQEESLVDNYKLMAENARLKIKGMQGWIMFWILTGTVVAACLMRICIMMYRKRKRHEVEVNEKISLINKLEEELELNKYDIQDGLKKQFSLFNKLVGRYYGDEEAEMKSNIFKDIKHQVKSIQENKDVYRNLEKTVNDRLDNLMNDFLQDFPKLQPWEPSLFLFTVLGFSGNSIGVFQGISAETINNRKSALRKKIIKSGVENAGRYLKYMGVKDAGNTQKASSE